MILLDPQNGLRENENFLVVLLVWILTWLFNGFLILTVIGFPIIIVMGTIGTIQAAFRFLSYVISTIL